MRLLIALTSSLIRLPEAKPRARLEIVVVEHFGNSGRWQAGAALLPSVILYEKQLIAPGLALEGAGDVNQHEACRPVKGGPSSRALS